jgi:hypothetical protein
MDKKILIFTMISLIIIYMYTCLCNKMEKYQNKVVSEEDEYFETNSESPNSSQNASNFGLPNSSQNASNFGLPNSSQNGNNSELPNSSQNASNSGSPNSSQNAPNSGSPNSSQNAHNSSTLEPQSEEEEEEEEEEEKPEPEPEDPDDKNPNITKYKLKTQVNDKDYYLKYYSNDDTCHKDYSLECGNLHLINDEKKGNYFKFVKFKPDNSELFYIKYKNMYLCNCEVCPNKICFTDDESKKILLSFKYNKANKMTFIEKMKDGKKISLCKNQHILSCKTVCLSEDKSNMLYFKYT